MGFSGVGFFYIFLCTLSFGRGEGESGSLFAGRKGVGGRIAALVSLACSQSAHGQHGGDECYKNKDECEELFGEFHLFFLLEQNGLVWQMEKTGLLMLVFKAEIIFNYCFVVFNRSHLQKIAILLLVFVEGNKKIYTIPAKG